MREGDYILIVFFGEEKPELYNLDADPEERNNLVEAMPEKVVEMQQKLQAWLESVEAEGMDPNPDYDPEYTRDI